MVIWESSVIWDNASRWRDTRESIGLTNVFSQFRVEKIRHHPSSLWTKPTTGWRCEGRVGWRVGDERRRGGWGSKLLRDLTRLLSRGRGRSPVRGQARVRPVKTRAAARVLAAARPVDPPAADAALARLLR
eukprot:30525-Pelagococcus_subviridis.AAC.6